MDELHTWLSRTADQLQGSQPISIDLQACEIELAKHKVCGDCNTERYLLKSFYCDKFRPKAHQAFSQKTVSTAKVPQDDSSDFSSSPDAFLNVSFFKVLRNDVMSHVRTMESLNQAGRALLEVGSGDSPHGLQPRLEDLNESWEFVRCETERRQLELENRLSQVCVCACLFVCVGGKRRGPSHSPKSHTCNQHGKDFFFSQATYVMHPFLYSFMFCCEIAPPCVYGKDEKM